MFVLLGLTENDAIIMIESPEEPDFEPDLNFNLLFDGLSIIQQYNSSHLSHKDKVHLETRHKIAHAASSFRYGESL